MVDQCANCPQDIWQPYHLHMTPFVKSFACSALVVDTYLVQLHPSMLIVVAQHPMVSCCFMNKGALSLFLFTFLEAVGIRLGLLK